MSGFFRPARPGRDHRISSSLSPFWSRICCNMLRPPLQRVAALRPGCHPAGRPPPRTAWAAARPPPLRSLRQPAGWPCAPLSLALPACRLARRYGTGRAARQARIRSRSPHCSDPSWSFGIQFTPPGGLTGGLEFHRSRSIQGFVSAQRADSQRSCADPAPSCWTALPGGVGPQPTGRRVTTDVPRSQ